jgi:predicted transcriptional regulator
MDYQRKHSAGKIDTTEQQKILNAFQNMQRMLQAVQIRNPFAEFLKIPDEVFKPRRTNAHYLAFIELITYYHQQQREKKYDQETGEEYIETTLEDIAEANKLMKEILLRKSDELNGATRSYFEKLKKYLNENKRTDYINREIRQYLRIKGTTLRRYHNELLSCGMIKVKAGKKNVGYQYEVVSYEEYQKLHDHINGMLDEILNKLQASEPHVSQSKNGSPKKKSSSKLANVSQ